MPTNALTTHVFATRDGKPIEAETTGRKLRLRLSTADRDWQAEYLGITREASGIFILADNGAALSVDEDTARDVEGLWRNAQRAHTAQLGRLLGMTVFVVAALSALTAGAMALTH